MVDLRLPFLVEDTDRHGNVRLYARPPGGKKTRLRDPVGSPAFMAAYHAALAAGDKPGRKRTVPGSFRALCDAYFGSPTFRALDVSTRNWRRRALERVAIEHGDKPAALLEPKHVRELRDDLAETPGAANSRLKAMQALYRFGLQAGVVQRDPTKDVERIRYKVAGHHSWTIAEVAAYEARWPIGTRQRLALALLLYTAGRREDVVRIGPAQLRGGRLRFTQAKNEDRAPVEMDIPVHDDLAAAIAATVTGTKTFLVTSFGKPFTAPGFGNAFRDWCNAAGLPHCSAHGLRKATATRLAERGASAHMIQAITGHKSLAEVERYTAAARGALLADQAMKLLD